MDVEADEVTPRSSDQAGLGRLHDPRHLAVGGTLLLLVALVALTVTLNGLATRSKASIQHVNRAIDSPLDAIERSLDASSVGEAELQLAAATTGTERTRHLEASIAAGETGAKSWTRYQEVALPLDGEPALAARYERDHAIGKKVAAKAIVAILRTDRPAALAPQQMEAAAHNGADLRALRAVYEGERAATLRALEQRLVTAGRRIHVGSAGCIVLIAVLGLAAVQWAGRTARSRRIRARAAELATFESRLVRGLELLETDEQVLASAARALAVAAPSSTVAISVMDHGGSAMRSAVGSMACGVDRSDLCPAVRAGATLHFASSTAMDACPHLEGASPCSATCLPISIAGRSAGVVQLSGQVDLPPEAGGAVQVVVRRVGERITMMRAIARFEHQASCDPLTGLINRRSLESEVSDLQLSGTDYAVAFADLDHFKRLNDDHGHQAGDRALRAFASTLTGSLRGVDLACRWGGEEFVMVLPGCDEREAAEAMERVRALLVLDGLKETEPPVTVSIGVAVVHPGEALAETVARADEALNVAKTTGRNRVVRWMPSAEAGQRPEGQPARR